DSPLLAYALIVPFLIILYLLELFVIFRHRKTQFKSSFFRIFSILAIVNISACSVGTFVFRLPLYPIVNGMFNEMSESNGWLVAAYSGAYYFNCLSEFMGVLQAYNRFTTMFFPLVHIQLWRWAVFLVILFCIALAPVWYLFDDDVMFVKVVNENCFTFQASIFLNMFMVSGVCNALSTLFYGSCLVRMWLFTANRNHAAERNLFVVGFLTMIFSLPFMAAMVRIEITSCVKTRGAEVDMDVATFVAFQLPWLTDLKYLAPAPMLLFTNAALRKSIRKI
ncbi:hypothetical protein PMAYCL1PPCAC_09249, partial [Pristionchus mayeri]